jgi:transposase
MRAIEEELNFHTTSVKNENCSIITSESMPYNAPTTTTRSRHRRRSPAYNSTNTYYSSATLIDSDSQNNKKISKKSSFFINRIFKKAFPKLFKKNSIMNIKYPSSNQQRKQQKQQRSTFSMESIISCDSGDYNSSYFPRSSTDETLNVYSTTNSSDYKKPVNVLDLLPAMNSNNTILA